MNGEEMEWDSISHSLFPLIQTYEPGWPSASEEGEEEEEMTGLLDRYAARKRKRQEDAEREADRAEGSNRLPTDVGSKMQAIVVLGSPEMGSND